MIASYIMMAVYCGCSAGDQPGPGVRVNRAQREGEGDACIGEAQSVESSS